MPTRKVSDPKLNAPLPCYSRDHTPPTMQVFSPGYYEHTCSECGLVTYFRVDGYSAGGMNGPSWQGLPAVSSDYNRSSLAMAWVRNGNGDDTAARPRGGQGDQALKKIWDFMTGDWKI